MLLTCFPHLVLAVSQQFKNVHLQLARGRAVRVFVDAFFGQRDGQTLPSAALHGVVKDGRWEEGGEQKGCEKWEAVFLNEWELGLLLWSVIV